MNRVYNLDNKIEKNPKKIENLKGIGYKDIKELFGRLENLKAVSSLNFAINQGKSLKEIIELFSKETRNIFSGSGATVYLLSEDNRYLVMQNNTTPSRIVKKIKGIIKIKIPEVKIPVKEGSLYFGVLKRKKPLLLDNPEDIQKLILEFAETVKPGNKMLYASIKKLIPAIYKILKINSVAIVPLISNGKPIGVIDISRKNPFKESDIKKLITFSEKITTSINRKLVEEKLKYTYDELNAISEIVGDGIRVIDSDFNVLRVNRQFCKISGVSKKGNLTRKCYDAFPGPDCHRSTCILNQILNGAGRIEKEFGKVISDNKLVQYVLTALPLKDTCGKIIGMVESFKDISEIKKAKESILEGNEKHRELAERLNEMIVEVDPKGKIIYANKKTFEKTGYTKTEIEKGINIKQVVVTEDRDKLVANFEKLLKGKELTRSIYTIKRKDGSTLPVITYPDYILNNEDKIIGIRELLVDVTDIKEAEEKIRESEERYRSLFENSLDGIYRTTLEGKYIDVNPFLVKMLGYDSKDELIAIDIPTQLYLRKEDRPEPSQRNRIFETRLKRKDGPVITVEINSRVIYKDGKPVYYEGIVRDVTERKITEKKLKESYQKLQKTLSDVIDTLASIVESKDPYTSGHQKRVAMLATAISEELGLDQDKIESIKIAALIHDIGKINIPVSILTRPGRLSEIEYDMIKTHSQLGHDMISRVEFPWPIADIILQHHERINGSGYPKGLKGKDIVLEARILAVADVVEAMASHRPYRPALGMDKALEEINNGKGKLYDPEVVDICTRLMKNKKFNFTIQFKPQL